MQSRDLPVCSLVPQQLRYRVPPDDDDDSNNNNNNNNNNAENGINKI
jgi:hypothetical protein